MKTSTTVTFLTALALAATGTLMSTQKDAKATSVATTTTQGPARLYTVDGKLITNRALAPNTPWAVGKTINLNGETLYQVATNEYLRAQDSSLSNNDNQAQTDLIGTVTKKGGTVLISKGLNDLSNNWGLPEGSQWHIGKYIVNRLGKKYVQVSNDDYVPVENMSFNHALPEPTSDYNFYYYPQMEPNYDPNHDYFNDVDFNTDNSNEESNNQTNQTANDYKPDLNKINDYFVKYLNALHAANGTTPVQTSSDMAGYAQQRASQQDGQNLDHSTATRETSENLSSAGFDYMINYGGVRSDKDAAYFLLKDWYDEAGNYFGAGSDGHYGHRAALIYSGPNVGLGITNNDASFDADWNYGTLNNFNALYHYTGSNPDTHFISKDAVQ